MELQILDEFKEEPSQITYVGLARRFKATLLDAVLVTAVSYAISYVTEAARLELLLVLPSIIDLLYKVVLEKEFGQTLGKKAFGMAVVGEDLRKITWQQSLVRNYYYIVSTVLVLIQYYISVQPGSQYAGIAEALDGHVYLNYFTYACMIAFIVDCLKMANDTRNQTMHDKWANTFVVRETFFIC